MKYDMKIVMKKAHDHRAWIIKTYAPWQIASGIHSISRSDCLKVAWRVCKKEYAETVRRLKIEASPEAQRIIAEIKSLEYLDSHMSYVNHKRALDAKLDVVLKGVVI